MTTKLRILVVEDTEPKFRRIDELLSAKLADIECHFAHAGEYVAAIDQLKTKDFDVVVLDLLIPAGAAAPNLENSRGLLQLMLAGQLFPPMYIIGLTEYLDAASEVRQFYESNMLALEVFAWDSEEWADRIAQKLRYVVRHKKAYLQFNNANFDYDLLLVTARYQNEYKPILKQLTWASEPVRQSPFFPDNQCVVGQLVIDGKLRLKTAFICVEEKGIAASAAMTSHAIATYRPRFVSMVGMCAGFNSESTGFRATLGDVIIARETASWEEGKYAESRFIVKSVPRRISDPVLPIVSSCVERAADVILPRLGKYLKSAAAKRVREESGEYMRQQPEIVYGTLVSGSSVIADESQVMQILQRHPGAVGLEMEMFGVYTAAERSVGKKPCVIGVKGVADFGTKDKHDRVQAYASILSYHVLGALLREIYNKDPRP